MRGMNHVMVSGTVEDPLFDETNSGTDCATFRLVVEGNGGFITAIRCNAYGPTLVQICRSHMAAGCRAEVYGELMKRKELTEVRIKEVVFI